MNVFVFNLDVAERGADVFAHGFVVIARNEKYLGAMPGTPQHLLHHGVLRSRPVNAATAHGPEIDNIAQHE
jgi:hypothetical protein